MQNDRKNTDLASLGVNEIFLFLISNSDVSPPENTRKQKDEGRLEIQRVRANELACIQCNKHMRKCAHVHTLVKKKFLTSREKIIQTDCTRARCT